MKDFEGRFYNAELDAGYTVTATDGRLRLFHIRLGNIPLTDAGKDKFSGQIGFVSQIEFVRNASGAVAGFLVSNYGSKNVRFEKVAK